MPAVFPYRYLLPVLAFSLATGGGCVSEAAILAPPPPGPTLAPATSTTAEWPDPLPDSDPDRVHRAATQAVSSYLSMTDLITSQGGGGSNRMVTLTTPTWFPTEEQGFSHYRREGLRTLGTTRLESLVVKSLWSPVDGGVEVDVVACVDARWVWLVPLDAPDPPEGLMEWLMAGQDGAEVDDEEFEQWSDYIDTHQPQPGTLDAVVLWLVGPHLDQLAIDGTLNWEGAHTCHQTDD